MTTLEFLPNLEDSARLGGLLCTEVDWVNDTGKGPLRPEVRKNSEFMLPADMVLLAMGFTGPEENPVFKELEIVQNNGNRLERDSQGRGGWESMCAATPLWGRAWLFGPWRMG